MNQPNIEPIKTGYRLEEDFSYTWMTNYNDTMRLHRISVKAGFEYDGNSIPRWLWTLLGMLPDGLNRAAGLIHDFIYRHRGNMPIGSYEVQIDGLWYPRIQKINRASADNLYKKILIESGYDKYILAYRGVRLGGWWSWGIKSPARMLKQFIKSKLAQ